MSDHDRPHGEGFTWGKDHDEPPAWQLDPNGVPPNDDEPPPDDDQAEDAEPQQPTAYVSRFITGDTFILDHTADPEPIWGDGPEVLWSAGEPCILAGPIGAGKTTMVGRLTRGRLGLDKQLLGYQITPGTRRVLYLACDRPRQIGRNLARMFTTDDRDVLADKLVVWPGPPPTDFAKTTSFLLDMCRKADADTVVVDGLKDVALELSKDDVGAGLNQAFQRCVAEGIEVIGNHHPRKATNGTIKKPDTLADLYGSTWIPAGAGTVLLVWADRPGQAVVEFSTLKPAVEHVGPLDVLHDLDRGTLEVTDATNVETILRTAGGIAITLMEISARLGEPNPTRNQKEALRRQLRRLIKTGAADSLDVPNQSGGLPEKRYLWTGP